MLDYAVIGTSWITQSFIDGTKLGDKMHLAGVMSRSRDRGEVFAKANGAETVFTDIDGLCRSDIPAVYVASPNSFHAGQTKKLLEAGKHVICEKPVTVTPRELDYLQNLAAKNNLVYVEAIMYMFNPMREALRKAVSECGVITSANIDFSQLSSKYAAFKAGNLPNIFNPAFATGCLEDLGIYCIYPVLDLFGMPKDISAFSTFMSSGADGCGCAVFGYDGFQANLTWSKLGQSRLGSQIFGDEGTVTINSISQLTGMNLIRNDGSTQKLCGEVDKARLMANEAEGFYDIIVNGEKNSDFYALLRQRAAEVSRIMEEIRKKAGISFICAEMEDV